MSQTTKYSHKYITQVLADAHAITRDFYQRKTTQVARDLLGTWLVRHTSQGVKIGRIVETEAYLGKGDLAAHTARGKTPRTQVIFGPAGFVYVYLVYGMHHMLNIVTEGNGAGRSVLIRALEPVANLTRNTHGPGRLCKAMGIDMDDYGLDLCGKTMYLLKDPAMAPVDIVSAPRVGVDYAGLWADKPLRFYIKDNPFVSVKPRSNKARRQKSRP